MLIIVIMVIIVPFDIHADFFLFKKVEKRLDIHLTKLYIANRNYYQ